MENMLDTFRRIKGEVESSTQGVLIDEKIFSDYYLPLIQHYIDDKEKRKIDSYLIGMQGCQGVGKTVLTTLIKIFLKSLGYKIQGFSIDDFYKPYAERLKLAKGGNTFYRVRGVPGTHRYKLLFKMLKKAKMGHSFEIPGFDKSLHNGMGGITNEVTEVHEKQDFVILEGWCVNIPYVQADKFVSVMEKNPYVKNIFTELDPKYEHFKEVLDYIKEYQKIWELFDNKTFMIGKNIEWIEEWRAEQEQRMILTKGGGMTRKEVHEFVKPYIPFTYLIYDHTEKNESGVNCSLRIGWNHLPEDIKIYN